MNNCLYTLEGRPKLMQILPFSLQQVLIMFVANLVPAGIIGAAASPALTQEEMLILIQASLIASGIATFIQATPIWKVGSGLPIFMGVSFTFVVPLSVIAGKYGYNAVIGTVLVGGVLEGLLGLTVRYWQKLITPLASACVVTGIGLSLLPVSTRSFGGGYTEDFGSASNVLLGFITLAACIIWMVFVKGARNGYAVLVGLIVGYVAALVMGKVDFSVFSGDTPVFSLPKLMPFKPVFRLDAMASIFIIYLVSATETLGDAAAIANGGLHRDMTSEEKTGVLMIDGLGSSISALFGGTPVTSFSENVGLSVMTGVMNRYVARVGGVMLLICGLFSPVGKLFQTVPEPVIGGVMLLVMGQIVALGMEMIAKAGFSNRNKLIVSISMAMSIGFTTSSEIGIWDSFPEIVRTVFSQNVVAMLFVTTVLLELVLPKSME